MNVELGDVIGAAGLVTLIVGATMIGIGFQSYDITWRLYYGKAHLQNAVSVTEIPSTVKELLKAREILSPIPRTGNSDPFSSNPRNDLASAWLTLDEMIDYAQQNENTTGSTKQLVIYNIQEKSAYFFDSSKGRWVAFEDYRTWRTVFLTGALGFILAFFGSVGLIGFGNKSWIFIVVGIAFAVVVVVFGIYITTWPVWYTGPV